MYLIKQTEVKRQLLHTLLNTTTTVNLIVWQPYKMYLWRKCLTISGPVGRRAGWAGYQVTGWPLSWCWQAAPAAPYAGTCMRFSHTHCPCLNDKRLVFVKATSFKVTGNIWSFVRTFQLRTILSLFLAHRCVYCFVLLPCESHSNTG